MKRTGNRSHITVETAATATAASSAIASKQSRLLASVPGSKANGEYLSREFYHQLIQTNHNIFSIPKPLLLHSPQIKQGHRTKATYKSIP